MSRTPRSLPALWLIAIVALISGCGGGAPGSTGAGTTTSRDAKFASCMRSNGVGQFPDPPASGNFTIDEIANSSSLNTSSPAFTQALHACRKLEPAGFTGSKRSADQQRAALRFARCMRANGVGDFPDPVNGEPLVDTNRIPSVGHPGGMSALKSAMHSCSYIAAQAGVTPR
jgi:hypothetical protein